ncbi:MAG TPA: trypsin-like serine protease [Kofleriaceae bacterium]|nr:trypsin-like serine protease [Kofleriaceae bacterium]
MGTRTAIAVSLGLALAIPLGVGCGMAADGDVAAQIGEARAPIVGGTPTNQYPAVPLLYSEVADQDGAQLCSGTLISPRVVLTAAHCVEFPDGAPSQYVAYFGADVTVQSDPERRGAINIVDFVFHPEWDIDNLEAGHDIGLVLLEQNAPVAPMPFNRAPVDSLVGQQVHLVGWGKTTGDGEDVGVKREAMSDLQSAGPLLMRYGSAAANTCQGDSGGPNFMTINGVESVAGITSYGNVGCDQFGFGTRVDAFAASFIDPYIAEHDPNGAVPSAGTPPPGDDDEDDGETDGATGGPSANTDDSPVSGGCSVGGGSDAPGGFTLLGFIGAALALAGARRRRHP